MPFMHPRITGRCRRFAALAIIAALFGTTAHVAGVRMNTSYSLPLGLYVATSDNEAPYVEFCPEGRFAAESSERDYRARGFACPDGRVPLLKPVVARLGDHVETTEDGLIVNGRLLPNTAPMPLDAAHRPLQAWPFASYTVQPGTIWVASTYNHGSYDSRYMGPIALTQVRRRLRALWTF